MSGQKNEMRKKESFAIDGARHLTLNCAAQPIQKSIVCSPAEQISLLAPTSQWRFQYGLCNAGTEGHKGLGIFLSQSFACASWQLWDCKRMLADKTRKRSAAGHAKLGGELQKENKTLLFWDISSKTEQVRILSTCIDAAVFFPSLWQHNTHKRKCLEK